MNKIAISLISMLKTIILLQVLVANEVLATGKVDSIEGDDESIKKYGKLLETGKLSKSNKKLFKFKKPLALEHIFILAFTNIWIQIKAAYFLKKRFFKMLNIKLIMQNFWLCLVL